MSVESSQAPEFEAPLAFNPFDPAFHDDPYARYRQVREDDPIFQSPLGGVTLFRFADVVAIVHESAHSVEFEKASETPMTQMMQAVVGDREFTRDRSMLNVDPPDHTRLRKLVSKAFTPRAIRDLGPRIQALVDEALDDAERRGEMDVIADLAFPLPFTVISEMLGMPPGQDRDQLREWSGAMVKTLDPILTPEEWQAAFDAGDRMEAYLREVIEDKRRDPGDDMLSALIAAEEEGDALTTDELTDHVGLLYIAGHETTVNLIGNGTYALLRNRAELERLRDDPSLDGNAIEELLRYDSPVQFTRRIVLEPTTVDGRTFEPGQIVICGLGAANRDPERFAEPDRLDLSREDAKAHVSFGGGLHFCLGAALARLEGRIAITSLVRRFPGIVVATDRPARNGRVNLRGLAELPVSL